MGECERCIDAGMGVVVGWVRLEPQAANFPVLAKPSCQHRGIKRSVEEAAIEAVSPLKSLSRPVYAGFSKACSLNGR